MKSILNGPAHAELNPHYLFVQPKSFGDLEARLRKRKSDSEEQIQIRVATARKELEASKSVPFEKFLTNDVLEDAYKEFEEFMLERYPVLNREERVRQKAARQVGLGAVALLVALKFASCMF